jgi:hypothetical protein
VGDGVEVQRRRCVDGEGAGEVPPTTGGREGLVAGDGRVGIERGQVDPALGKESIFQFRYEPERATEWVTR